MACETRKCVEKVDVMRPRMFIRDRVKYEKICETSFLGTDADASYHFYYNFCLFLAGLFSQSTQCSYSETLLYSFYALSLSLRYLDARP